MYISDTLVWYFSGTQDAIAVSTIRRREMSRLCENAKYAVGSGYMLLPLEGSGYVLNASILWNAVGAVRHQDTTRHVRWAKTQHGYMPLPLEGTGDILCARIYVFWGLSNMRMPSWNYIINPWTCVFRTGIFFIFLNFRTICHLYP